jgi:hypothetical protein
VAAATAPSLAAGGRGGALDGGGPAERQRGQPDDRDGDDHRREAAQQHRAGHRGVAIFAGAEAAGGQHRGGRQGRHRHHRQLEAEVGQLVDRDRGQRAQGAGLERAVTPAAQRRAAQGQHRQGQRQGDRHAPVDRGLQVAVLDVGVGQLGDRRAAGEGRLEAAAADPEPAVLGDHRRGLAPHLVLRAALGQLGQLGRADLVDDVPGRDRAEERHRARGDDGRRDRDRHRGPAVVVDDASSALGHQDDPGDDGAGQEPDGTAARAGQERGRRQHQRGQERGGAQPTAPVQPESEGQGRGQRGQAGQVVGVDDRPRGAAALGHREAAVDRGRADEAVGQGDQRDQGRGADHRRGQPRPRAPLGGDPGRAPGQPEVADQLGQLDQGGRRIVGRHGPDRRRLAEGAGVIADERELLGGDDLGDRHRQRHELEGGADDRDQHQDDQRAQARGGAPRGQVGQRGADREERRQARRPPGRAAEGHPGEAQRHRHRRDGDSIPAAHRRVTRFAWARTPSRPGACRTARTGC